MYTVHCTGTSTVAVVVHSNCPYTQEQSLYTLYNRRRHTRHRSSYPAATVIHSNCPYTQESNRYIHFTTGGAIHGICSHNQQLLFYTAIVVIKNKYNSSFICCYTHQLYVNKSVIIFTVFIHCSSSCHHTEQLSSYTSAVVITWQLSTPRTVIRHFTPR